jgi:hypothetical protein
VGFIASYWWTFHDKILTGALFWREWALLRVIGGRGQPLSFTLSFGKIPWFDEEGEIRRCDWSQNAFFCIICAQYVPRHKIVVCAQYVPSMCPACAQYVPSMCRRAIVDGNPSLFSKRPTTTTILHKPPLPDPLKTPPFFSQWAKLENFFANASGTEKTLRARRPRK